jgi:DNA-binding response OmpR family regulator
MLAKQSILIVEDDATVREILADQLAGEHGFTIFTAETLGEADTIIADERRHCDAVILDIGMPDGDGRDFCSKLRRQGHKGPVIMLTGRDDEADIIHGLNSGADDYVAKPFRLNELLARLRAQLRIFESSDEAIFSVGRYAFHPGKKLLHDRVKNRRVWLTTKEVAILKFLYRSHGSPVDRQLLLQELWGHSAAASVHTLETHIHRLRKKIERDPKCPTMLVTMGGGYCINPEVSPAGEV